MKRYINIPLLISLAMSVLQFGCYSNPCPACDEANAAIGRQMEPWTDHATGKLVEALAAINEANISVTDSIDLFIDRSSGMKYHFTSKASTITIFTHLYNSLSGTKQMVNCFGLDSDAKDDIYRFPFDDMSQVFLQNPAVFYNGASSPLDKVMRLATEHKDRQTVFVTDGELAVKVGGQSRVDPNTAWTAEEFSKWLSSGNDLDFIIQEFPETHRPTVDSMRLFFIFFTPRAITEQSHSAIKQFLKTAQPNAQHFTHLSFSGAPFLVQQANQLDQSERNAGINSFLADEIEVANRHEGESKQYSHIHVPGFKETFDEFVQGLADKDFEGYYEDLEPKQSIEKGSLFHDLWVECKSPCFATKGYRAVVHNLESASNSFLQWKACTLAQKATDEEGNNYWCQGDDAECQTAQPNCPPQYLPKLDEQPELFTVETKTSNTPPFPNSIQLRIVPSKHFDPLSLTETNGLWIEIFPEAVEFHATAGMGKLMWPDTRGPEGKVIGLHASMVQALIRQSKELSQHPIYSYFITF